MYQVRNYALPLLRSLSFDYKRIVLTTHKIVWKFKLQSYLREAVRLPLPNLAVEVILEQLFSSRESLFVCMISTFSFMHQSYPREAVRLRFALCCCRDNTEIRVLFQRILLCRYDINILRLLINRNAAWHTKNYLKNNIAEIKWLCFELWLCNVRTRNLK